MARYLPQILAFNIFKREIMHSQTVKDTFLKLNEVCLLPSLHFLWHKTTSLCVYILKTADGWQGPDIKRQSNLIKEVVP